MGDAAVPTLTLANAMSTWAVRSIDRRPYLSSWWCQDAAIVTEPGTGDVQAHLPPRLSAMPRTGPCSSTGPAGDRWGPLVRLPRWLTTESS